MNIKRIDRVKIVTTPAALRHIANCLEHRWNSAQLGEEVPFIVEYGVDMEIEFRIDQEEMHRLDHIERQSLHALRKAEPRPEKDMEARCLR